MPKCRENRKRRNRLFEKQNGLCFWCEEPMVLIQRPAQHLELPRLCTLEHLRSKAHPGRLEQSNGERRTVAACWECNRARGSGLCWTPPLGKTDPIREFVRE